MIPASDLSEVGGTLVEESERLDRFVRDLLELARLESEDFGVQPEPVDLGQLVVSATEAWAGLAARLRVRFEVAAPPEPVVVWADPMRLRQMVDGLVENALRVNPAGQALDLVIDTVEHPAEHGQATARLRVRDRGPGLTQQDLDVVFERGALHERYRDSRPVGTGLGLSIAHRLAVRMEIGLAVEAADGGGAVFTLSIPLAPRP
jgi:two-component system sensor histidine kinase BaeS